MSTFDEVKETTKARNELRRDPVNIDLRPLEDTLGRQTGVLPEPVTNVAGEEIAASAREMDRHRSLIERAAEVVVATRRSINETIEKLRDRIAEFDDKFEAASKAVGDAIAGFATAVKDAGLRGVNITRPSRRNLEKAVNKQFDTRTYDEKNGGWFRHVRSAPKVLLEGVLLLIVGAFLGLSVGLVLDKIKVLEFWDLVTDGWAWTCFIFGWVAVGGTAWGMKRAKKSRLRAFRAWQRANSSRPAGTPAQQAYAYGYQGSATVADSRAPSTSLPLIFRLIWAAEAAVESMGVRLLAIRGDYLNAALSQEWWMLIFYFLVALLFTSTFFALTQSDAEAEVDFEEEEARKRKEHDDKIPAREKARDDFIQGGQYKAVADAMTTVETARRQYRRAYSWGRYFRQHLLAIRIWWLERASRRVRVEPERLAEIDYCGMLCSYHASNASLLLSGRCQVEELPRMPAPPQVRGRRRR